MANSNPSSPTQYGLAGNFSADDIQELLGAMAGEHHRPSSEVDFDEDRSSVDRTDVDGDAKAQARSERKRSREKQRRSDVNRQFGDLTALLKQIEAEEAEEDKAVARLAFSPTNRVDMIARTITHLERLRAVNKRRKKEIESLQQQLELAKKAGEDTAAKLKEVMFNQPTQSKQVMMMVPMMVSADGTSSYGAGGAAAMPMMNPFMMPQPYMMPQIPQPGHQAVQQPNMQPQQPMFPGFAMAPQQQAPQPVPAAAAPLGGQVNNPMASAHSHAQGTASGVPQHTQFAQGMPAQFAGMPVPSWFASNPAPIAPNPMSFFMPQNLMAPQQAATASSAPVDPRSSSAASPLNDQSTNSATSAASNTGDSKEGGAGMQGGSNLAHCA